jgi:RecA-family ATPase
MTMPVTTAPLLEWALWYASQGHPVFPLHSPLKHGCSCRSPGCTDIGKHPRIRGGLTNASTDPERITTWWHQWPLANIGLRTGITLWALDIDPRKGGDTELYHLEETHGELPETPRSKTGGGGNHLVFALPPEGTVFNKVDVAPGIDVRGDGGYIIMPPSYHASGHQYAWDVVDLEETALAQAPPWLLELCARPAYDTPTSPDALIPDGKRNDTLSRMAFAMRKAGMSLKEIHTALDAVNQARCQPPLDAEELLLLVEGKRHIGPEPFLRLSPGAPPERKDWPDLITADEILQSSHTAPLWLIPGLIPEGLTIVGGLPKVAKSYFAYDIALACAGQGLGLGHFGVARGVAAYLAIEDDPADTQQRIQELRPGVAQVPNLFFLHGEAVPSISDGLVEYLRAKVTAHGLSLVVIDPLSYVYDPKIVKNGDSFREAKDMLLPLRQLARELHFALVFVDHRRKQGKDDADVFQTLYGSVAKYAVADVLLMMVRRDEEVTLHCRGRKIKDQVITCELAFVEGHAYWKVSAANDAFSKEGLRRKIIDAFHDAERLTQKRAFSVGDIMDYAEVEQSPQMKETFRVTMFRMCKDGLLIKGERNQFLFAGYDDSQGVVV